MTVARSLWIPCLIALVAGCGSSLPADAGAVRQTGSFRAAGLWSSGPALRAGVQGGRISIDTLNTPFLKDPSFVDGARPVGKSRYIAFGDLRRFYVKAFDVGATGLAFRPGETPLALSGSAADLDAPWAPQLRVNGPVLELYYCAGKMPAPEPPRWNTFRLHRAVLPVAAFTAAIATGATPTFQDDGPILTDLAPFGAGDLDFGVIDPCLFVNRAGRAYMIYTIVRPGIAGKRAFKEQVRFRRVDPANPTRPLGPDQPMYDGLPGSEDDGVAEAPDVVTLGSQAYAFLSSRPGDIDQRLLVARIGDDLGPLDRDQLKEFMYPGAEPWKARAVGSSSAAMVDGNAYMLYQGLDANQHFTLGWTSLGQ